ncbi:MAG: replicative DNA helicase [Actinobacteria bacterium]|nr:replicative DNA helicase [Actinomycetota bacterium]NBR66837.1 replicative DNA helicase [Actinomycetota bacterium]
MAASDEPRDMRDQREFRGSRETRSDSRIPPHNVDAEASLLGAMMLDEYAVGLAIERELQPSDFYKPAHQNVFAAIRALASSAQAVDPVTVADELRRTGMLEEMGGLDSLLELQNATPSVSSAGRYIQIVKDTSVLRRLIRGATQIADIGFSAPADVRVAIDQAEQIVFGIGDEQMTDTLQKLHDLTDQLTKILEDRYDAKQQITGVPTGYYELDRLLAGLQPGTLNVVGARPAMGKSAFALGMAVNVAKKTGRPVLFFSLEMGATELTQRIISAEAEVESDHLRTGNLSDQEWSRIVHATGQLDIPLYIDDTPQITVMQIRQKLRRVNMTSSMRPALVVVDYLQLMGGGGSVSENRQLEISAISRGLKLLAREFSLPVVALSQLSRGLEQRSDKRPQLSDLRESGAIEQDADTVMFLHRAEVNNADVPLDERGWADVTLAKHRAGPIGLVKLLFVSQFTQFQNPAR